MEPTRTHDSAVPAHGKQVISACAFIHHAFAGEEKLFLPKRADTKKFLPGLYELPGGHIDFGEDLVAGLQREIYEEFSMRINVGDPFAAFTYENKVKGSHTVEVIYFATFSDPLGNITLDPEDHSDFQWFTAKEVREHKDLIIPTDHVQHYHVEDPEYETMLRGFELLQAKTLHTG